MRSAPRWPWVAFAFCAVAGGAAVAWVSATALGLARAEAEVRARAALEENARLALWRMDLSLARLVALEAARPVEGYGTAGGSAEPGVLLHFEIASDGTLSSPGGDARRLGALRPLLVPAPPPAQLALAEARTRGEAEFNFRNRYAQQNLNNFEPRAPTPGMAPAWLGGELVLMRRVPSPGGAAVQGALLDWPAIRAGLLADVADLLPGGALEPVPSPGAPSEWMLASLPVRLVPGPLAAPPTPPRAPVWRVLAIAWAGALLALLAFGALLFGTLSLGARRAAFVSAVTHELRTPLTTFRLYSEMLEQGMVPPEKHKEYLGTLRREADRLGYLVENVLAWARLEGRGGKPSAPVALRTLLGEILPRLDERAAQAGMTLEPGELPEVRVLASKVSVEQVLFNLVDNSGKYAAAATDRRIHLEASPGESAVTLTVRDHGPGLPAEVVKHLFQPFQKSAAQAADSAQGVGLGLALSRRLARSMGGELSLGEGPGASFALTLKRVTDS